MKKFMKKKRSGQTIVEYILIVVLVAIAGIGVIGLFSDTLRKKILGAVVVLTGTVQEAPTSSVDILQGLDENTTAPQ